MSYQFPPDIEAFVKDQLASGCYASEDDLLRDAVRALKHQQEDIASIQAGIEDERAGRVKSLAEVDAAMRERYKIPPAE